MLTYLKALLTKWEHDGAVRKTWRTFLQATVGLLAVTLVPLMDNMEGPAAAVVVAAVTFLHNKFEDKTGRSSRIAPRG